MNRMILISGGDNREKFQEITSTFEYLTGVEL